MKKRLSYIFILLALFGGLSLLLYPTISDYWNSFHQSKAVGAYVEQVANLDTTEYDSLLSRAEAYNQELTKRKNTYSLSEEQKSEYEKLLNVGGDGIIGYIEIPKIGVSLPIYHGTEDTVLQIAIGHLEWTSLPIGGESTHSVLTGHRGLPSAKLFTNIDQLVEGDSFVIRVLDEMMTYEVDQILIVKPEETKDLQIVEGEDLCTLVTCTPYGVNSHRLLVRGHRIENAKTVNSVLVTAEAAQIEPLVVAPFIAVPLILGLFIWIFIRYRK